MYRYTWIILNKFQISHAHKFIYISLLLLSHSVVSDSLPPNGLQHTRPPLSSPSPEVCPSSCPLSRWCHPAISSSDTLFFFCPQSFPASGTFPMSQLFISDDQNTGVSALQRIFRVHFPYDWVFWPLCCLISSYIYIYILHSVKYVSFYKIPYRYMGSSVYIILYW